MSALITVVGDDVIVAELDAAQSQILPQVTAVVSKGALNIKNQWKAAWKGLPHARALPFSIGYDMLTLPGSISATIGPDKDRKQGPLGNLLEYGSENNAPRPGGSPALDTEAPKFAAALDALVAQVLP